MFGLGIGRGGAFSRGPAALAGGSVRKVSTGPENFDRPGKFRLRSPPACLVGRSMNDPASPPAGFRKGLTSYGDAGFSLFFRRAMIKGAGYTEEAISRPVV